VDEGSLAVVVVVGSFVEVRMLGMDKGVFCKTLRLAGATRFDVVAGGIGGKGLGRFDTTALDDWAGTKPSSCDAGGAEGEFVETEDGAAGDVEDGAWLGASVGFGTKFSSEVKGTSVIISISVDDEVVLMTLSVLLLGVGLVDELSWPLLSPPGTQKSKRNTSSSGS
jgi:hypothetical protein